MRGNDEPGDGPSGAEDEPGDEPGGASAGADDEPGDGPRGASAGADDEPGAGPRGASADADDGSGGGGEHADDGSGEASAGEGAQGPPLRPLRAEQYHVVQPGFDLGGYLRRLRRRFDLSQRELAAHLGVSQSAVAKWESGRRTMTLSQWGAVCELVGWRVVIDDAEGAPVHPMEAHGLARDAIGRLFPAHLDVGINDPDAIPWRPDLTLPPAGAPRRERRDAIRNANGVVEPHPSAEDVAMWIHVQRAARRERRLARWAANRQRMTIEPLELCICTVECEESRICVAACPCQCVVAA